MVEVGGGGGVGGRGVIVPPSSLPLGSSRMASLVAFPAAVLSLPASTTDTARPRPTLDRTQGVCVPGGGPVLLRDRQRTRARRRDGV